MKRLIQILSAALCAAALLCAVGVAKPAVARADSADTFFKDAVFLGDSLTVGLCDYVEDLQRSDSSAFPGVEFLAKVSYSLKGSLNDDGYELHPVLNGQQLQPQKSIAKLSPTKIFIMMGTNDIKEDADSTISNYKTLISRIQSACPGVPIFIQSVLPMTARKESGKMTNDRIDSLNKKIKAMCTSLHLNYIDLTTYFKNSSGKLNSLYSSDDYVHLNSDGYKIWVQALRDYAECYGGSATVTNVSSCVNLREKASTSSKSLGRLRNGETVMLMDAFIGNTLWHKVSYAGKTGYIHADYLELNGVSFSEGTIIKVSNFVNARSEANTSSDIVCTINKGTMVNVLMPYSANNNWCLVYYNKQYMFIRSDFIAFG